MNLSAINVNKENGQLLTEAQSIPAETLKKDVEFTRLPNAAQYGGSDFGNAVRVERHISLDRALEIAANDPNIDYFFYVNRDYLHLMVGEDRPSYPDPFRLIQKLGFGQGYARSFHRGDVVFFKKDENRQWFAEAKMVDIYQKVN